MKKTLKIEINELVIYILENINQFDKSKNLIDILPLFEKNKLELEEMRIYLEQLRDRNDWLEKNCKYGNNETEVEETEAKMKQRKWKRRRRW